MLKIKEIREAKKLSQDDMVAKTGIPKRSYVNYENEKSDIPLTKLQNIANVLGVKIENLIVSEPDLNEPAEEYENATLQSVRDEIRGDLKVLLEGMKINFENLSEGMFRSLRDQKKILNFIEDIDEAGIKDASRKLNKFLNEHQ